MSTSPASTNASQGNGSDGTTVGIGGQTSGQQGATPSHESQTETGGNGGPGLTRNQSGPYANAPDGAQHGTRNGMQDGAPLVTDGSAAPMPDAPRTEATKPAEHADSAGSASVHVNPGATDTRPDQAGPKVTGMGAPETGGNQSAADLPPFTR